MAQSAASKRRRSSGWHYVRTAKEPLDAFKDIVCDGAYLAKGMPKFGDRLSEQDVSDIRRYILSEARDKTKNVVAVK